MPRKKDIELPGDRNPWAIPRLQPRRYIDAAEMPARLSASQIPRLRDTPAVRKLVEIFVAHANVYGFLQQQPFYRQFKVKTAALGLATNFDEPPYSSSFTLAQSLAHAPLNEALALSFLEEKNRIEAPSAFHRLDREELEQAIQDGMEETHRELLGLAAMDDIFFESLQRHFNLLFTLAKSRYPHMAEQVEACVKRGDLLGALGKLNEFYRDKIGNEIIALERNERLRTCLTAVLEQELNRINAKFKHFDFSEKPEGDETKNTVTFRVEMDPRDPHAIFRGTVSSDCTDPKLDFAFHETVPQHLLDPGFINFRLMQGDGENALWVGNIYNIVMEENGEPVLVIDALQTSADHPFPAPVTVLAEAMIEQMRRYAKTVGFKKLYLSRFISNRGVTQYFLDQKYPLGIVRVKKVGGFEHLKQLGLWNKDAFRNEYLETLMAGNPNEDEQFLPLRRIEL